VYNIIQFKIQVQVQAKIPIAKIPNSKFKFKNQFQNLCELSAFLVCFVVKIKKSSSSKNSNKKIPNSNYLKIQKSISKPL